MKLILKILISVSGGPVEISGAPRNGNLMNSKSGSAKKRAIIAPTIKLDTIQIKRVRSSSRCSMSVIWLVSIGSKLGGCGLVIVAIMFLYQSAEDYSLLAAAPIYPASLLLSTLPFITTGVVVTLAMILGSTGCSSLGGTAAGTSGVCEASPFMLAG